MKSLQMEMMLPPSPVVSLTRVQVMLDPPLSFDLCGMGIDPGQVNMGLAFVYKNRADLYQIKLPGDLNSVDRIQATGVAVAYLIGQQPGPGTNWLVFRANATHCVIEGAAHNALHGQVPLAENRTAAAIQVMMDHIPAAILPPAEIKSRIFGKANLRARDFWPYLQIKDERDKVMRDDAAAALSCAFYAYAIKRKDVIANQPAA